MNRIHTIQKMRFDIFGVVGIGRGEAVSWKEDNSVYTRGYAVPYNGKNLLGISYDNVLAMNLSKHMLTPTQVSDGSKIRIIEEGELILLAKKKWKINTPLRLNKWGEFKRAKQWHKIYGVVKAIDDDGFALVYFNKYGIVK